MISSSTFLLFFVSKWVTFIKDHVGLHNEIMGKIPIGKILEKHQ